MIYIIIIIVIIVIILLLGLSFSTNTNTNTTYNQLHVPLNQTRRTNSKTPKTNSKTPKTNTKTNTKTPKTNSETELPENILKNPLIRLRNKNNSCYFDSILKGLFHCIDDNYLREFIYKDIINQNRDETNSDKENIKNNIRLEILDLFNTNRTTLNINNLRKLLNIYYITYLDIMYHKDLVNNINNTNTREKFKDSILIKEQLEPNIVNYLLIDIFNIDTNIKRITRSIKNINNLKNSGINVSGQDDLKYNGIQIEIDQDNKNDIPLNIFLPSHQFKLSNSKQEVIVQYQILNNNKLIFADIKRYSAKVINNKLVQKKLFNKLVPDHILTIFSIEENKNIKLNCVSIIVHIGELSNSGHYLCFYNKNKKNIWYLYDDMKESDKLIGNFDTMLKYDDSLVLKNSVGIVYM